MAALEQELDKKRKSISNNLAALAETSGSSRLSTVQRPRPTPVMTKGKSKEFGGLRASGDIGSPRSPGLSPKSPGIREIFKVSDNVTKNYDPYMNKNNEGKDMDAEEWVCIYCVIVNMSLAMCCKKCGAHKGTAAAPDWECAHCNAKNKGCSIECKQCRKPKQAVEEPRSPQSPASRMRASTTYRGSKANQIGKLEKDMKELK